MPDNEITGTIKEKFEYTKESSQAINQRTDNTQKTKN